MSRRDGRPAKPDATPQPEANPPEPNGINTPRDYVIDITEWGYADVVGKGLEERHDPITSA